MSRKASKMSTVVAASNVNDTVTDTVTSAVEFVVAPVVEHVVEHVGTLISDIVIWEPLPELGPINDQPQPFVPVRGQYFVRKPSRSVTKRDSNDLGRAVTLILQLLPLTDTENLTGGESNEIQQLLLRAAYLLETADSTPMSKCKIDMSDGNDPVINEG